MKFKLIYSFILVLLILCVSCKNKTQHILSNSVKTDDLEIFFTKNLYDSTSKLDSFKVIRLDTITKKDGFGELFWLIAEHSKKQTEQLKEQLNILKLTAQQVRLSKGLSQTLYTTYKEDFEDAEKKFKSLTEQCQLITSDMKTVDSLSHTSDSLKPLAFKVLCKYQLRKSDRSVIKDSSFIYLNRDHNIVRYSDYLNGLIKMYPLQSTYN